MYRARQAERESGIHIGDLLIPFEAIVEHDIREVASLTGSTIRAEPIAAEFAVWKQDPVRLGVYQSWTASIDEGWARWVLDEYGVPYDTLHNARIRQGGLRNQFDALLIPEMSEMDIIEGRPEKNKEKEPYPPEFVGGLGEAGLESLRQFVTDGGTLIASDRAAGAIIDALSLPVENPLRDVTSETFACPGSLLRVVVDNTQPLGLGLPRETAVLFMDSRVFSGTDRDITTVGRYPRSNPRLSGWIHGASHIEGKGALVEVAYGEGRVVLIGFRPYFRAQARGTYRVLFNAINRAGQSETTFG